MKKTLELILWGVALVASCCIGYALGSKSEEDPRLLRLEHKREKMEFLSGRPCVSVTGGRKDSAVILCETAEGALQEHPLVFRRPNDAKPSEGYWSFVD